MNAALPLTPAFNTLPRRQQALQAGVLCLLLAAFVLLRARYEWVFEYEAEESSIGEAHFVLHHILPRAYHHIRFSSLFVGPLHAYLKAIPYFFTLDPKGDILFLILVNAFALALLFFFLRRVYGFGVGALALFFFIYSTISIERCTSAHVRCYSVPLTLILMVVAARVLVLRERRPYSLAIALAFATQVYGLGMIWIPPGLVLLWLVFRPKQSRRDWMAFGALLLVWTVVPFLLQEIGWDRLNWRVFQDGTAFRFDPIEIEDVSSARAKAWGAFIDVADLQLPIPTTLSWILGILVCVKGARRWRDSVVGAADLFLVLWLLWFLLLPLLAGVGHRTYLGQFLAPIVMARGLLWLAEWALARRGERLRIWAVRIGTFGMVGSTAAALLGPAPTEILSDPMLPIPTLNEERELLSLIRARGLGRPGFNSRVHGPVFQVDSAGDPYLFWVLCHADRTTPCDAGSGTLSPQEQLVAVGPEFPYSSVQGDTTTVGRYRLLQTISHLSGPLKVVAAKSDNAPMTQADDLIEKAVRPRRPGGWSDEDFLALPSLRRTSFAASLMASYGIDPLYRQEARSIPIMRSLDVELRTTLTLKQPVSEGQSVHLFLTTDFDNGRCQADVLLDGKPISVRRTRMEAGSALLLGIDADTGSRLAVGDHAVTIQLSACSIVNYDLYDLIVSAPTERDVSSAH